MKQPLSELSQQTVCPAAYHRYSIALQWLLVKVVPQNQRRLMFSCDNPTIKAIGESDPNAIWPLKAERGRATR